jgi:hypothetical protein
MDYGSLRPEQQEPLDDKTAENRVRNSRLELLYRGTVAALVLFYTVVVLVGAWVVPACKSDPPSSDSNPWLHTQSIEWTLCRHRRLPMLLYLNLSELDFGQRMLSSLVGGAIIGVERRTAGQAAGVRTMSLVSLGACIFTICSIYGFQGGNMEWDSSRVAAAIPSGVGFIGAGVIWKGAVASDNGDPLTEVHGLTTAASIWLAAAVGLASGGGQNFLALFGGCVVVCVMRLLPRRVGDSTLANKDD